MSPLKAVHRAKVAFTSMSESPTFQERFGAISIPYLYTLLAEQGRVGASVNKPQELVYDSPEKSAFGGQKGQRRVRKGETEGRRGEYRDSASAGTICARLALDKHAFHEREVLVLVVHGRPFTIVTLIETMFSRHGDSDRDPIRETDNDAALARLSAVQKRYLDDPYIKLLVPRAHLAPPRPPLINIGTYHRSSGLDALVHQWLQISERTHQECQIVSFGAGSDTRFWRTVVGQYSP